MPVTMRLRPAILAAGAGLFVFSAIAVAQDPDGMSDRVSTVTLTPPSVVEDNRAVTERLLAHPICQIWGMPTLREDHQGRPVVYSTFIDIRESMTEAHDNQPGLRGLEGGWNCGGTDDIYPPDPIMAAGPAHLIVATNQQFKIYTKDGTEDFVSTWGLFFSDVKPPGTFTTDPKVIYDHDSGRWFLLILAINSGDLYSYYLLAVSDDADPNGTWMKYALDSTLNGENPSNNWSDYPGLGVSADAIYVTSNMFSRFTGSLQYAKIRVLPKQQLLDFETTLTWSDFWDIDDPGGGKAFTIQPAQHWGTPPVPFLVDSNPGNQISVFGVNDPLGSPTLTSLSATVNNFATPPSAEQLGGLPNLDTIDTRVYNAVWRNDYIYCAHNRNRVNNAGSKWYKISTADWPSFLTVDAQGSVGDNTVNMWFPSVAVNQNDTLVIGFSHSSTSTYASIYYAFRPANGVMSDPLYIHYGNGHYIGAGYSLERWGDYTGTVVDPEDDRSFWHYNQFPNPIDPTKWRTWVAKFTVGCPNPGGSGNYCTADIDGSGDCIVGLNDLAQLLGHYGTTTGADHDDGDLDGDGDVDLSDLAALLGQYGDDCN